MTGTSDASFGANSLRLYELTVPESEMDDALSGLNNTGDNMELVDDADEVFGKDRVDVFESVCGDKCPDVLPT